MTTKIENAIIRKSNTDCKNTPYFKTIGSIPSPVGSVKLKSCKLTRPVIKDKAGIIISLTKEDTILPNAVPITTPTAMSTTLPRIANSLKSLKNCFILFSFPTL